VHVVTDVVTFVHCSEGRGRLRVMSIKTSLSMMSAGKFVDKLKCTFTCSVFKIDVVSV